jgi:hypothetical protein
MRRIVSILLLVFSVFSLSDLVIITVIHAQPQRPERPKEAVTSPAVGIREAGTAPEVKIWTDKGDNTNGHNPIYYVGEQIYISFQLNKDSYLTLYDIDSTGNVNILFPNPYQRDNFVRGGRIYTIPAEESGYNLVVKGPTGKEILYALASSHVYYHWQYEISPPPLWADQWGAPTTWGHQGGGYDYSLASRRFQKRLQLYEETNLAALTLSDLKKQIELPATVGCPLQTEEKCQCSFYVTIPPY